MLLNRHHGGGHSAFDEHVDMTAMVDVTFQLMTFLLLTYQASVEAAVEMPQARYGVGVEEVDSVLLTVAPPIEAGDPPQVYVGRDLDPKFRLDGREAIREAVEKGLISGKRRVVIQADGNIPYGEILRIGAVAGEVQGISLHIGVAEPK